MTEACLDGDCVCQRCSEKMKRCRRCVPYKARMKYWAWNTCIAWMVCPNREHDLLQVHASRILPTASYDAKRGMLSHSFIAYIKNLMLYDHIGLAEYNMSRFFPRGQTGLIKLILYKFFNYSTKLWKNNLLENEKEI